MTDELLQELVAIVGESQVTTNQIDRITHSYDATQKQFLPDAVVYARTTEEISGLLQVANKWKVPVFPRGAGSGLSGGAVPTHGGIALVLTKMDRILSIDSDNLVATVEPGVVTAELQRQVEKVGLFYPPDPASKEFSTLGGNVAECAGGPRCLKYGVTKDYVLGLEVVTPTGEIIKTGGETLKSVAGYDLTKLFVGSEGTLGIITKIILKLLPKPAAKKTMLIFFDSIDGAAESVSEIIKAKIIPTTLEFMDKATISCIRGSSAIAIPESCQAILIIEVDGDPEVLDTQAGKILAITSPLGTIDTMIAETPEESEEIWQVRRIVSPSLRKINPDKFNEDIVVPRSKVPEMIRILEQLSDKYDVPIVNFGHAGDGNIHVNIMVDITEAGMEQTVDTLLSIIFQEAIKLKGSISGEHGIGTAKAKYLEMELGEATLTCMKTIKQALDPENILNPGKIFYEQKDGA